jgi:RNA polymerase sigma factor (sigma-70 family)
LFGFKLQRVFISKEMSEPNQLLRDYVEKGSDAAFRELVSRYIGLVYSTALRLTSGDTHLAEDISQTVFIDLARNAPKLSRESTLGGWLHRDTCFVGGKMLRTERRRTAREREAALMNSTQDHSEANLRAIAPVLDEAIDRLDAEDHTAIVLRFFEQHDFRTVGTALGTNEDAARMRVNRALQKLYLTLRRQGVTMSAAALGAALTAEAVTAAPVGLAIKIATTALTTGVAATTATSTAIKLMAITKTQAAICGAVVALAIAAPFVLVHNAKIKSQADQDVAEARLQSESLATENVRLSNALATVNGSLAKQSRDLTRLRNAAKPEVTKTSAPLPAAKTPSPTNAQSDDNKQEPYWASRGRDGRNISTVLLMYSLDHQGKLPEKVDELGKYLEEFPITGTNQFDIVYHGSFNDIQDRNQTIVVRESQPQPTPDGKWSKIYGFADGHSEVHAEANHNFDAYEKEHGITSR